MNLPFTPTFFKKLDIYQQLVDYEKAVEIKPIWKAEKVVLLWAIGRGHQHIGSYISTGNVKDPLEMEVKEDGRLGESAVAYAVHIQQVLDALVVRGLAEAHPSNSSVRINQNGFIAGKIIEETDFLTRTFKYRVWTWLWWGLLTMATIILVNQTINALLGIFNLI